MKLDYVGFVRFGDAGVAESAVRDLLQRIDFLSHVFAGRRNQPVMQGIVFAARQIGGFVIHHAMAGKLPEQREQGYVFFWMNRVAGIARFFVAKKLQ